MISIERACQTGLSRQNERSSVNKVLTKERNVLEPVAAKGRVGATSRKSQSPHNHYHTDEVLKNNIG